MLTADQLHAIMPYAHERVEKYLPLLNDAMPQYAIDTPARMAAFLAQIAHESGELRYTAEIASGEAYEGRKDLGNTQEGDGVRYKGRGLIQITGRTNYAGATLGLDHDFISTPEDLELPGWATVSACWWWFEHGLNLLADSGDFERITKRINGALGGYESRCAYWYKAKEALGC